MKLGILFGVIIGLVVVAIGVAIVLTAAVIPLTREISSPSPITATFSTVPPVTTLAPTPLPTTSRPPVSTVPTVSASRVDFALKVTNFAVNGYSASVTAQVSNSGNTDAHNLQAQVQAVTGGTLVQVNGANVYIIALGNLKAGQTISVSATLDFTFLDGLKISEHGATLNLWLVSDEKTQTFSYDYIP